MPSRSLPTLIALGAVVATTAIGSVGCGSGHGKVAAKVGECTTLYLDMGYAKRPYKICVPSSYDIDAKNNPFPVVLNFHGWGDNIDTDLREAQVWAAVQQDATSAFVVHPQGYGDNTGNLNTWGSWHINGTGESPGPAGPTCNPSGGNTAYCYTSCQDADGKCDDVGCSWTTCVDDYAFITALLDAVEDNFCCLLYTSPSPRDRG